MSVFFSELISSFFITIEIAFCAAFIGLLLALSLAIFLSAKHTPHRYIAYVLQISSSLICAVPDVFSVVLIAILLGSGISSSIIAVAVTIVGVATPLFAHALDNADHSAHEGLVALGAYPLASICCGVIPLCYNKIIDVSLYCINRAIYSALAVGIVSESGLGALLIKSANSGQYLHAIITVGVGTLIVMGFRIGSAKVRE